MPLKLDAILVKLSNPHDEVELIQAIFRDEHENERHCVNKMRKV
jgi:hypothetical protein